MSNQHQDLIARLRSFVLMDGGDIADIEEAADALEAQAAELTAAAPSEPLPEWSPEFEFSECALHRFIYSQEPAGEQAAEFRADLLVVLEEARQAATPQLDHAAAMAREPMTAAEIIALRRSVKSNPNTQWGDTLAFARAVEAHHGIAAAPQPGETQP